MLATHGQENVAHGHQQAAALKPLNQTRSFAPKTPGNKYTKTPLKIPLNDENSLGELGAKSGNRKGQENLTIGGKKSTSFESNAFVTPMGPRARAPLGAKTTNAKAKPFQTPAATEKDCEKTLPKPSSRRAKKVTYSETLKIAVHGDYSPLREQDVEYAPPRIGDQPYESEDFPRGCLNYEPIRRDNLMRGVHRTRSERLDEEGNSELDREMENACVRSMKMAEEAILKSLEEWKVVDVPAPYSSSQVKAAIGHKKPGESVVPLRKASTTINSRRAASALSIAPKSTPAPPEAPKVQRARSVIPRVKSATTKMSGSTPTLRHAAAAAASRSTIGYTKGRTASGALQTQKLQPGMTKTMTNASQISDSAAPPLHIAHTENESRSKRLGWLDVFIADEIGLEPALRDTPPSSVGRPDEDDEEFVMTICPHEQTLAE